MSVFHYFCSFETNVVFLVFNVTFGRTFLPPKHVNRTFYLGGLFFFTIFFVLSQEGVLFHNSFDPLLTSCQTFTIYNLHLKKDLFKRNSMIKRSQRISFTKNQFNLIQDLPRSLAATIPIWLRRSSRLPTTTGSTTSTCPIRSRPADPSKNSAGFSGRKVGRDETITFRPGSTGTSK